MDNAKLIFISSGYVPLLKDLPADATGKWGKMNGQQMVEHLAEIFMVSTEKLQFPLVTAVEFLPKFREFLLSDKQFRENTRAPVNIIPEEPVPPGAASMNDALAILQNEINEFVSFFKNNPGRKTCHPVFGELDFDEWVLLHHKHMLHHIKQFGLL